MQIVVGQQRWESVRVVHVDNCAFELHAQPVTSRLRLAVSPIETGLMDLRELSFAASRPECRDADCARNEDPQYRPSLLDVRTKVAKRIGVASLDHRGCL